MTRLVEEVGYPSPVDIRTEFTQILGDIEAEMSEVLNERGGHARPLYEMLAYHLGLDGAAGRGGKRIRPLLGVLAYQSLGGDYRRALPGAAAVEWRSLRSPKCGSSSELDVTTSNVRPTASTSWTSLNGCSPPPILERGRRTPFAITRSFPNRGVRTLRTRSASPSSIVRSTIASVL